MQMDTKSSDMVSTITVLVAQATLVGTLQEGSEVSQYSHTTMVHIGLLSVTTSLVLISEGGLYKGQTILWHNWQATPRFQGLRLLKK